MRSDLFRGYKNTEFKQKKEELKQSESEMNSFL